MPKRENIFRKIWQQPVLRRLITIAVGVLIFAALAWLLYATGFARTAMVLGGATGMFALFYLGLMVIRLILSPGSPVFGVARTLVDEAMHAKVGLAILLLLSLLLPAIWMINPQERLEYRLQFSLFWAMTLASILLSALTIFLACGTICDEIQHRQIFMTMTKPVSRAKYLLGKWLGVVLIDLLMVAVAGIGIFTFANIISAGEAQSAEDYRDRQIVEREILTARESALPQPPNEDRLRERIAARLEDLRQADPVRYGENISPEDRQQVVQQVYEAHFAIPPRNQSTYIFTGLGHARDLGKTFTLRMKPNATTTGPDEMVHMGMAVNGRPLITPDGQPRLLTMSNRKYYRMPIPADTISPDGRVELTLANVNPATLRFDPNEGLEILYQVGTFGGNLSRSMGILWLRLCFIAALALAAGTFLSFPIACTFTVMIYIAASTSGYITESLHWYSGYGYQPSADTFEKISWVAGDIWSKLAGGDLWGFVKHIVKLIGMMFMAMVPTFSDFNPTTLFADGRNVPLEMVQEAFRSIALWTAITWAIAWLIFRRRELARVTV